MNRLFALLLIFFVSFGFAKQSVSQAKIIGIEYRKDEIVLTLNQKPTTSHIKSFTLTDNANKLTRAVFDISAVLTVKEPKNRVDFAKSVRISQFDAHTVRLVLSDTKSPKTKLSVNDKTIVLHIEHPAKKEPSVAPQAKPQPQPQKPTLPPQKESVQKEPARSPAPARATNGEIIEIDRMIDESLAALKAPNVAVARSDKRIVVIDAGHGGKDPGALGGDGKMEKDIVFRVAMMTKEALTKRGFRVFMTRDSDEFIELSERTKFANHKNADLFLSIHANAVDGKNGDLARAKGVETYFLSPAKSEKAKSVAQKENSADMVAMDQISKGAFLNFMNREKIVDSNKLAIDLQRSILGNLRSKYKDTVDNGVREAPFWVLVGAQMPSVLIEVGYLTHPEESDRLMDAVYQAILAKGIADGVESYFANN